jgi:hypothetical protein
MHSDVHNLKLILKLLLANNIAQDDLSELVHNVMKDRQDLFNGILLIYGKTMMEQFKHLKVNKIYNYNKFTVKEEFDEKQ